MPGCCWVADSHTGIIPRGITDEQHYSGNKFTQRCVLSAVITTSAGRLFIPKVIRHSQHMHTHTHKHNHTQTNRWEPIVCIGTISLEFIDKLPLLCSTAAFGVPPKSLLVFHMCCICRDTVTYKNLHWPHLQSFCLWHLCLLTVNQKLLNDKS